MTISHRSVAKGHAMAWRAHGQGHGRMSREKLYDKLSLRKCLIQPHIFLGGC